MRAWLESTAVRYAALVMSIFVLVMLLLSGDEQIPGGDAESLRGPRAPDAFAINATYRAFDSNGQMAAELHSIRVEHFEAERSAELQAPRGFVQGGGALPWHLTAEQGRYLVDQQILQVQGQVRVTSTSEQGRLELQTERLTVDNNARMVHTDQPVLLTMDEGTTRSSGMRAWMDQRVIELNSQVEGIYAPEQVRKRAAQE